MNMYDYHREAQRTSPNDGHDKMDNALLGLIGETGELVDVIKKFLYQSSLNAPLPWQKLQDELGDVLWYLVELAAGMDCQLAGLCGSFAQYDERAQKIKIMPSLKSVVVDMDKSAAALAELITKKRSFRIQEEMNHMLKLCSYIARIAGTSLDKVADANIAKLKARYPEGFDSRISEARYE